MPATLTGLAWMVPTSREITTQASATFVVKFFTNFSLNIQPPISSFLSLVAFHNRKPFSQLHQGTVCVTDTRGKKFEVDLAHVRALGHVIRREGVMLVAKGLAMQVKTMHATR